MIESIGVINHTAATVDLTTRLSAVIESIGVNNHTAATVDLTTRLVQRTWFPPQKHPKKAPKNPYKTPFPPKKDPPGGPIIYLIVAIQ